MNKKRKDYDKRSEFIKKRNKSGTAVSTSNMEQNPGNASLAKKKIKRPSASNDEIKPGVIQGSGKVKINVFSARRRLADSDGISAKAVIDGLVLGGILQNDSPQFVKEVNFSQKKVSGTEYTIIEILPVEGEWINES